MGAKIIAGIIVAIGVIAMVFLFSVIGGTLVYWLYPHIHALLPNAAAKGYIAQNLSWWDSVCITWLFGILLKTKVSNTNNNEIKQDKFSFKR